MCGIVGIVGAPDPVGALLSGLATLEYRGYDSAGFAFVERDTPKLWRVRAAEQGGSVEKLQREISAGSRDLDAGIGHTRWATHGAPTEANAHPHIDCTGAIAIVHNGIIENHRELSEELVALGHRFRSETDTEVIAHLIEEALTHTDDLQEAVRRTVSRLTGDYAIAVCSSSHPDMLVAARHSAPLIVGKTNSIGVVGSDVAALIGMTRDLYQLADGEIASVTPGAISVIDTSGLPVELSPVKVTWDVAAAQKGGFPDFMSKEIREQPEAVSASILGRIGTDGSTDFEELSLSPVALASFESIVYLACGSSYHAAIVARDATESWARVHAEVEIASEFRYRDVVLDRKTLAIAVSQSGETVDTLHALHHARSLGATTVALTNVVGSLMSREADGVLYTRAGPEIGVASTKCHLSQLVLLEAFALHLANARHALSPERRVEVAAGLLSASALVAETLESSEDYENVARRFSDVRDFYFLGRGPGYAVAAEGALKLKELAYVRAEAYPAGEMKHGPISLIEPGAVVVVVANRGALFEKVMSNIAEMRARGASIIAVCDQGDETVRSVSDATLEVPPTHDLCAPFVSVPPLQLFAYAIARQLGNDVDRPRNLAKVVTVE